MRGARRRPRFRSSYQTLENTPPFFHAHASRTPFLFLVDGFDVLCAQSSPFSRCGVATWGGIFCLLSDPFSPHSPTSFGLRFDLGNIKPFLPGRASLSPPSIFLMSSVFVLSWPTSKSVRPLPVPFFFGVDLYFREPPLLPSFWASQSTQPSSSLS